MRSIHVICCVLLLCDVCAQTFRGLRRWWLAACDAVGRDAASMAAGGDTIDVSRLSDALTPAASDDDAAMSVQVSVSHRAAELSVRAALSDRERVSVVGDLSTRPRVCASVYGGVVAMFLPSLPSDEPEVDDPFL
jgi:hypothetical protein